MSLFVEGLDRLSVPAVSSLFIDELDGLTFSTWEESVQFEELCAEAAWEEKLDAEAERCASRSLEDSAERGGWFGYGD